MRFVALENVNNYYECREDCSLVTEHVLCMPEMMGLILAISSKKCINKMDLGRSCGQSQKVILGYMDDWPGSEELESVTI